MPVILYFAGYKAFDSLFEVYFYNLLFRYSTEHSRTLTLDLITNILNAFPFVLPSIALLTISPRKCNPLNEKILLYAMIAADCCFFAIAAGWDYAYLPMMVFLPYALAQCYMLIVCKHQELADEFFLFCDRMHQNTALRKRHILLILSCIVILCLGMEDSFLFCIIAVLVSILFLYGLDLLCTRMMRSEIVKMHRALFFAFKYSLLMIGILILYKKFQLEALSTLFAVFVFILALKDCSTNRKRLMAAIAKKKSAHQRKQKEKTSPLFIGVVCVLFLGIMLGYVNPSAAEILRPKEQYAQYKFAEYIRSTGIENPVILNYQGSDAGLYWAANVYPPERYFCFYNIELDEIEEMNKDYLDNQKADFVVTHDYCDSENYHLVMTEKNYSTRENLIMFFYLYEKNAAIADSPSA